MKLVSYPRCLSCGASYPGYESELLGVRVCATCLLAVRSWLDKRGLILDSHVLVTELLAGVSEPSLDTATTFAVYEYVSLAEQAEAQRRGFTVSAVRIRHVEKFQSQNFPATTA